MWRSPTHRRTRHAKMGYNVTTGGATVGGQGTRTRESDVAHGRPRLGQPCTPARPSPCGGWRLAAHVAPHAARRRERCVGAPAGCPGPRPAPAPAPSHRGRGAQKAKCPRACSHHTSTRGRARGIAGFSLRSHGMMMDAGRGRCPARRGRAPPAGRPNTTWPCRVAARAPTRPPPAASARLVVAAATSRLVAGNPSISNGKLFQEFWRIKVFSRLTKIIEKNTKICNVK